MFRKLSKIVFTRNGFNQRFFCSIVNNKPETSDLIWDVTISGGGMVGCALAASLGSSTKLSEKKILVLESSPKTEYVINENKYSNRVCALNSGTKDLFEDFDGWNKICNLRMRQVKKMVVWESCSDARISFQHDFMQDDIAYIVENDVILNALYAKLATLSNNVKILKGVKASDYTLPSDTEDLVTIKLQNGDTIKTKLLIGADGVNSLVRQKMNVKYISWNYNQKGLVATLKLSEPTENIVAWQRFLPTGPIALLPLTNDLCSLVWTVSVPMCDKLLNMPEEQFVDALNSALWNEPNKNSLVDSAITGLRNMILPTDYQSVRQLPPSILSIEPDSRAAFPLGLGHATQYVAPRVALIGDSAHRVHPLAGQGVNLGFGDVKCLTECLETSVHNGSHIADMSYLLDYESKRQRHVVPMMLGIDALNRLYGTEFMPAVLLRSLGVAALDACQPMKNIIMNRAAT